MAGDSPADALAVALEVARAFEAVGAGYFLGGSLASSLQGEPRSTNDVDFVVSLPPARAQDLANALGADFEVDEQMLRQALARGTSCNVFHLPSVTKVDLFGLGDEPYDRQEFERRVRVSVTAEGAELWVKTPEDTVLRKLWWYRQGGEASERQWRDVVAVLQTSGPSIDNEYMTRWGDRIGVNDLLAKASAEVES